jgi:hypothetical protein
MWIPSDEQDLVSAIENGALQESLTFDAKREIPPKNVETAKDVSAFANTAGGVLLYGVDEDSNGRPSLRSPIKLDGQRERIEQIIRTSIDEVPRFNISAIPTESDPSEGYLITVIPPSERAPHMVIVRGERRYYGRGETGNYVLSQIEIARLYERRQHVEASILPLLDQVVQRAPLPDNDRFAQLHIVANPVLRDERIFERALSPGQKPQELLGSLIDNILSLDIYKDSYVPDFGHPPSGWTRCPEGYLSKRQYGDEAYERKDAHVLNVQINLDGSAYLLCGRAGENQRDGNPPKFFFSGIVAGNTTKFLALLGDLYNRACYFGGVDVGVALTGLLGCVPYETRHQFHSLPRFEGLEYRKTALSPALSLRESPKQVAAQLLMPLVDAISQGTDDPFKDR